MGTRSRRKRPSEGVAYHETDDVESSRKQQKTKHAHDEDDDEQENDATRANDAETPSPSSSSVRNNGAAGTPIRSINPAGKPPEAGVIRKVYVENFMCHRKWTMDFCRNVNFIHGQNGSGKSAVLAAIQICLGAGARRTHRARNLKELVRKEAGENCSGAKVRVTLLNRGDDGYQREVYGDTITVERTISLRGGYNGYKLLDHELKERSRSKKDLDAMLDQLNIQVENPVAVLDQEEAKKFLMGKAEDKYAFFSKATELERIDHSYAAIVDNISELRITKDRVQLSLQGAIDNVKVLKGEWEQFQALEKLEEKVLDHSIEYAWAFCNECEAQVAQAEKNLQTIDSKIEKRQQELAQAEEACNATDEEEQKRARVAELTEEASVAAQAKTELEMEHKRATAPVKAKDRELHNLQREQKNAGKRLVAAKRHLQEARDQIMEAAGSAQSEEARRTARLKEVEMELEEARQKTIGQRQAISENLRRYEELEPHVEQSKQNTAAVASQLSAVKHKIRDLQSSENSGLAMFGRNCARVHQMVEKARKNRKFRGPVVGPIGAHIKIAPGKEQFASIAEHAIGFGTLDRFVVTNDADRQVFMKIRRDAGCSTRECGVFQIHNGARFKVPPPPVDGIETVASCLNVTNDLVFNCLVDHVRIDQRALANSKQESERALLMQDSQGRYKIRGGSIRDVYFLPSGDYWQVTRTGGKNLISNDRQLRQTIGVDKSAAIAQGQREADELKQELDQLRAKEAKVKQDHKEYKVKWNNENRAHRETNKVIDKLMTLAEELKSEAEAAENITIDTTELEEDVDNAEHIVEGLKEQASELQREIEALQPTIADYENRLDELATRNDRVLEDLYTAEQELEQYFQSRSQREAVLDKKRKKLDQLQNVRPEHVTKLETISDDRDKALRKARMLTFRRREAQRRQAENPDEMVSLSASQDEMTEEALESIEPVETRKDAAYYRTKIERAKRKIAEEKERRRLTETDPEVAYEKYMRAKKDLDAKTSQIDAIETNVDLLREDMKSRKKRWRQWRKHIAQMTSANFDEMLNKKGSSGEVEFDHENGALNLVVQKDNRNEMSQTKDVKALSGGERSFTTLSLLLALGEQLETPFRVMDEFDVFLDPVSRKIALETLVSVAKELEHRQFIFITPQDLSSLKTDPMLKIVHMKNPTRNNEAVGGPSQQTLDFGSQP